MSDPVEIAVGATTWTVSVPATKHVFLARDSDQDALDDATELLRAALERPVGIDAAMRRAVTPEDRVAIVVDERIPNVGQLVGVVLEHLDSAGISSTQVTLVVPPPGGRQDWIDDLPDAFDDVHVEVHNPEELTRLAYVATTKAGRRIYLNRTIAEADFLAVLTRRVYHPTLGVVGGELDLFPVFSNAETRQSFAQPQTEGTAPDLRSEASEVLWLLGAPFLLQFIEGHGDEIAEVLVGLPGSSAQGLKRLEAHWKCYTECEADLVIAAVSGDPAHTTLLDLATALNTARRAASSDARLVLLTEAAPMLDEAMERLRRSDSASAGLKAIRAANYENPLAAQLWARAANAGSLFIASDWPEELVEELFATSLSQPGELQRLIDAATKVVIIPDAHKTRVEVERSEA